VLLPQGLKIGLGCMTSKVDPDKKGRRHKAKGQAVEKQKEKVNKIEKILQISEGAEGKNIGSPARKIQSRTSEKDL